MRAVVLSTTSATAFCAGAGVGEVLDTDGGIARMEAFAELYRRVELVPVPTIAVCVGSCVGAGAEIVAGCDLRVVGDNLKLACAGARLGVLVGPARLPLLVGPSLAKELVYTGRPVGAEQAVAIGLARRVSPAAAAEARHGAVGGRVPTGTPPRRRGGPVRMRTPEQDLAREVAELAGSLGRTVAVAESLTSGRLAAALGAAPDASEWFRGGVVAYASQVKYDVLRVPPGPVMTSACAEAMARGATRLLGADLAVATTGVGGPGPEEGVPAGTVFLALADQDSCLRSEELHVDGGASEVVARTVRACLRLLAQALASPSSSGQQATLSG